MKISDEAVAWQNIETAEVEFLNNLADKGGLADPVPGMLRHCSKLLRRLTSERAAISSARGDYATEAEGDAFAHGYCAGSDAPIGRDSAITATNTQPAGDDAEILDEPMSLRVALDFADNPRPHHSLACPADTNGELYEALKVLAGSYRSMLSSAPAPSVVTHEPATTAQEGGVFDRMEAMLKRWESPQNKDDNDACSIRRHAYNCAAAELRAILATRSQP